MSKLKKKGTVSFSQLRGHRQSRLVGSVGFDVEREERGEELTGIFQKKKKEREKYLTNNCLASSGCNETVMVFNPVTAGGNA